MHLPIQIVKRIFYTILAVVGIPVNSMAVLVLLRGKCGLSSCTTRYLVAMAVGDLMVIIVDVILKRFRVYYYPRCFLDLTPVCIVVNVLLRAAIDCSVWFTVIFSFDRFVAICSQKLKTTYCTKKTAAVVLTTITILFCLKNVPLYFRFKPSKIVNNIQWSCASKKIYYTDPRWLGFTTFSMVLTPLIPFAVILVLNALILRRILIASQVRKSLKGQNKGSKHNDPKMESRMKSIILLFTISGNFIILWLLYILYLLDVPDSLLHGDDYNIFEAVAYMLRNLSCCTNTFIYVATQPKFRTALNVMLKYPFKKIAQYID